MAKIVDPGLLDKIGKLFECNVGHYIDLPQLVDVGNQSSGKSSVLQGLTNLPFPRDSGPLCTSQSTEDTGFWTLSILLQTIDAAEGPRSIWRVLVFKLPIIYRPRSRIANVEPLLDIELSANAVPERVSIRIIPAKGADNEHQAKDRAWSKDGLKNLNQETFGKIMEEVCSSYVERNRNNRTHFLQVHSVMGISKGDSSTFGLNKTFQAMSFYLKCAALTKSISASSMRPESSRRRILVSQHRQTCKWPRIWSKVT